MLYTAAISQTTFSNDFFQKKVWHFDSNFNEICFDDKLTQVQVIASCRTGSSIDRSMTPYGVTMRNLVRLSLLALFCRNSKALS